MAFIYANAYSQENPDTIIYNTELDGGVAEYIQKPDNYELDSLFPMEAILIDVNERVGLAGLQFGEVYEITFNISNIFQKDVVIIGFSKPCICIVPDWHKTPIAPGAVGFVKVKYTATVIGPSQKTFRAYLYDAATMQAVAKADINIKAVVNNINTPN